MSISFSGTGLTRAAYSKLYAAGFPPILDRKGEAPVVADPTDDPSFMLAKEESDRLQTNEIVLQFLAYSRYDFDTFTILNKIMTRSS